MCAGKNVANYRRLNNRLTADKPRILTHNGIAGSDQTGRMIHHARTCVDVVTTHEMCHHRVLDAVHHATHT